MAIERAYRSASMGHIRIALVLVLFGSLVQTAAANGAMGLALEMFGFAYWWPYVAVTVILEAWLIGKPLGDSWAKALGISLFANSLTAFLCFSGCFAVFLHESFVGSRLNPNPLLNAALLFTVCGLLSGLLESGVWAFRLVKEKRRMVMPRSLLAHMVGVPLGLAILLIPSRPYVGLTSFTNFARIYVLRRCCKEWMQSDGGGHPPIVKSVPELISRFRDGDAEPDLWAAAYSADFARFDIGEARRIPYELNTNIAWQEDPGEAKTIWLLRAPNPSGGYDGIMVNTESLSLTEFRGRKLEELTPTARP